MARYPIYIHRDVDNWVEEHRSLAGRADWLLAELAARGYAGRPKGVIGPSREVGDLPGQRWRRSGLGGFDYYAWWFEAGEGLPFPPESRVVRAVRPHDEMDRLAAGDPDEYVERPFDELAPLTEEQAAVVRSGTRVRLAVGHPGTGKTGALLYSVLEEGRLRPGAGLLYVTLSRGLADDARQFLAGLPELGGQVEVVTYDDLLARWGPRTDSGQRAAAISGRAEEQAFLGFLGDQPRTQLNPWQTARGALWAEVRAQLIGRALPFAFASRDQPACEQPFLPWDTYRRQRERTLGATAATAAWKLARRFVDSQPRASLQRQAWDVLGRIQRGSLDRQLRALDGLIVDEIQDLTLLQLAVLVEATRRMTDLRADPRLGPPPIAPCFIAAGDESQVVHPSGFDWGICKDLLRERLGGDPEEFQLATNQRSPSPLVEASNRTAALYDELPKDYRPQAKVEAEKTEAQNGRVYLCRAATDDADLPTWLETLRETPGSALVVCPGIEADELAPILAEERFADLCYEPALVKGLDRQYVVVWEASRALARLREDIQSARSKGDNKPRYLAARRAVDEFRVAVSRSNETLVFLDRSDEPRDPLLDRLVEDGVAEETTPAHLSDVLETRGHDPLERTLALLAEATDLLDLDLPRALRTFERAEGALEELHDPDSRRLAHERRIAAHRRAAEHLLRVARTEGGDEEALQRARAAYRDAGKQYAEIELSYRQLGQTAQADRYAIISERYLDTPPDSIFAEENLPSYLERSIGVLGLLSEEERGPALDEPRAWRDDLLDFGWTDAEHLRRAATAALTLAELTGAVGDRRAALELRQRLAELLVEQQQWTEALTHFELLSEAAPARLAACYEGLGQWQQAGDQRLAAGELERALEDYRQAGAVVQAAGLAEQLGREELAASLKLAGTLSQIGEIDQAQIDVLTDAERQHLAESLRRAADRLAPRHRPGAQPRGGTDKRRR